VSFELRSITDDEVSKFRAALAHSFGGPLRPEGDDRYRRVMPLDRTVAVFDGDALVGTLGDFPLTLTVPGGARLATAGTTAVTVRPTHTRRGILTSMMREHLDRAVSRGEPVAALWASEPEIYGRFGYGLATELHQVRVDTRHVAPLPSVDGISLELVEPAHIVEIAAPFWAEHAKHRSGFIDRKPERWQDFTDDPVWMRSGATESRHIIARRDSLVRWRERPATRCM